MRKFNKTVSSLVIVVLMGTVSKVNAQWSLSGNALSGGEKLGSTNTEPVNFYTDNIRQGTISSSGLWGIGTNGNTPQNKLLVENGTIGSPYSATIGGISLTGNESWLGIFSVSNNSSANIAVMGYALNTSSAMNVGVAGKAIGGTGKNAIGIYTEAVSAGGTDSRCIGISAEAVGGDDIRAGIFDAIAESGTIDNRAVDGFADGNDISINNGNVGVDGRAAFSSTFDIGVRGIGGDNISVSGSDCYGIVGEAYNSGGTTTLAGYFNGDVDITGNLTHPSDEKLKQNIRNYDNALEQIGQLNVKQYTFKNEEFSYMHLPEGNQVGVMAAELKKIFPNLVKKTVALKTTILKEEKGRPKIKTERGVEFDAVNYTALIPVLVQGVKELHQKVGDLEKQNSELMQKNSDLEKLLDKLCNSGCGGFAPSTAPADNTTGQNQLFQNIPNPFGQTTEIGYFLEASVQEAFIVITDMKGTVLKRFDGLAQGSGKITVSAENFAGGVYNYSLYVNGKLIDTKKMITAVKH